MSRQTVEFFFDLQCPRAYLASTRISSIAQRARANVIYTPVSLGETYEAPRGKAAAVNPANGMSRQKLANKQLDLARTIERYDVEFNWHPKHPVKTIDALCLLHATPYPYREILTNTLYRLYWVENRDISDHSVLLLAAKSLNIPFTEPLDETFFQKNRYHDQLQAVTQQAVDRGIPGVPTFWIKDYEGGRFFWGEDRLHFVEAALLSLSRGVPIEQLENIGGLLPRRVPMMTNEQKQTPQTLRFWFDFASLWSYIGYKQLERIKHEAGPNTKIEYMPIILGVLHTRINGDSTRLPLDYLTPSQRVYTDQDHVDWTRFWNIVGEQSGLVPKKFSVKFASVFPLRTITPLRVFLLEPKTIDCIFSAAWEKDIPFGKSDDPLIEVLNEAGFDGENLVRAAKNNVNQVKDRLRANTDLAEKVGLHGVPTFQVNGGELVFGQDRLNVVQDFLAGWQWKGIKEEERDSVSAKL